mgnify:CR=1 FL=1
MDRSQKHGREGFAVCLRTPPAQEENIPQPVDHAYSMQPSAAQGMTYSQFIGKLNAKGIVLNRKVLADLAMNEPKAFEAIVNAVK